MTQLTVQPDGESACAAAAAEIARTIVEARAARGAVHIALAGGNTPRRAYELLHGLVDDWTGVELWYGDERCVRPDDPDSNHSMVVSTLDLAEPPVVPWPVEHRILGELGSDEAARLYAAELLAHVPTGADGMPVLDLALLGLGEDGHTASLFPGHAELDATGAICLPVRGAPKPPPERVTLSLEVLRSARSTLLLVTGAGKVDPLARVLAGPDHDVPASLLGGERLHVVADVSASPPA